MTFLLFFTLKGFSCTHSRVLEYEEAKYDTLIKCQGLEALLYLVDLHRITRARQELRLGFLNRSSHSRNAADEDARAALRWCLSDERVRGRAFPRVVREFGGTTPTRTRAPTSGAQNEEETLTVIASILWDAGRASWNYDNDDDQTGRSASERRSATSTSRQLELSGSQNNENVPRPLKDAKGNAWGRLRSFEWSRSILDRTSVSPEDQVDFFRIQTTSIAGREFAQQPVGREQGQTSSAGISSSQSPRLRCGEGASSIESRRRGIISLISLNTTRADRY